MKMITPIVLACAVFSGCVSICNSTGGMTVAQTINESASVLIDDDCFANWLEVVSTSIRPVDSGCLKAQVTLRNRMKDLDDDGRMDDFTAQYKFTWLDADGTVSGAGDENWLPVTWHGGEQKPLEAVSPNPSSERFVLNVRHLR